MSDPGQGASWPVFRRLLRYARPYRLRLGLGLAAGLLASGSLFGVLANLESALSPLDPATPNVASVRGAPDTGLNRIQGWLDRIGLSDPDHTDQVTPAFVVLALVLLPLLVGARAVGVFVNRYYTQWVCSRVVMDLRNAYFSGLQQQSLTFFGKQDVGTLIGRSTNDAGVVESLMSSTVSDMTRAPFDIAVAVSFILWFSWQHQLVGLVLALLVCFPLCVLPVAVYGRRVRQHTRQSLDRIGTVVSRMHECFTGIRVVKAYHTEAAEAARFRDINAGYFRATVRALRAELMMTPLMEAVGIALGLVFLVVCAVKGVRFTQIIPVGVAAIIVYKPVKQLARIHANLQRAAAALQRLFATMDIDTRLPEAPGASPVDTFRESIVFDRVSFRYDPEGPPTLTDIDLTLPRGSVLALVGETGSGKTTLANLVARFYDPTEGRILLDGTDLRDLRIADLRRLIGVVTQETILFNDTIASNIAYGSPDATPAAIEAAARQANAHAFIMDDPAGYGRVVGEKGFVLSGGERQRIAIARAILRNPPILILDEATSALDTVTEALVQEAIGRLMHHRTVIAIAHRLSTVRHADQILVMDKGRVIERGAHEALWAQGGRYRRLCDMQLTG